MKEILADISLRLAYMPVEVGVSFAALPEPTLEGEWYEGWSSFMTRVRLMDSIYNSIENNHR